MRERVLFFSIRTCGSLKVLQLLTSAVDGSNFHHVIILACHIYVEILPFFFIYSISWNSQGAQFHSKGSVTRPI